MEYYKRASWNVLGSHVVLGTGKSAVYEPWGPGWVTDNWMRQLGLSALGDAHFIRRMLTGASTTLLGLYIWVMHIAMCAHAITVLIRMHHITLDNPGPCMVTILLQHPSFLQCPFVWPANIWVRGWALLAKTNSKSLCQTIHALSWWNRAARIWACMHEITTFRSEVMTYKEEAQAAGRLYKGSHESRLFKYSLRK